jgi:glycosyltransferase involved in cell wall biosynthesis
VQRKQQTLVTIVGPDGSGKTTLAEMLVARWGDRAGKLWCGAESVLMYPIRAVLRRLRGAAPGNGDAGDYRSDVEAKRKQVVRLRSLKPLYVAAVMFDFWLQYRAKMWMVRRLDVVVLDRYLFDVAVNIAVTLNWSEAELVHFVQRCAHWFAMPRVRIFIRIAAEECVRRKHDVPHLSYISVRLAYYEVLAGAFGFQVLDGLSAPSTNVEKADRIVKSAKSGPYVHYVHSNNDDVGGADYCLFRLANEIRHRQGSVSVSLRKNTAVVKNYEGSQIMAIVAPFVRPQLSQGLTGLLSLPIGGLQALLYFYRLYGSLSPDIVHVNDLYDMIPALAAKLRGIPVVYHLRMIRSIRMERAVWSWLISHTATVSISVSHATRRAYFRDPSGDHQRALVIHDWPQDTLVSPNSEVLKRPEEMATYPVNVIMVGRIEPWKGHHIYVEAVRIVKGRFPRVGFFMVGGRVRGKAKENYADKVLRDCVDVGIHYLGERGDVPALLRAADVAVHASIAPDPFPGVVLESLLAESATIATRVGGVVEMIESGISGLLVEPGDAAELADALTLLLSDAAKRKTLGSEGRRRILALTAKEKAVSAIVALYRQLAKAPQCAEA